MPYDERDVIFARMNYKEGDGAFEDYYERRPEKKRMDDILRRRPLMGDKLSHKYNPLIASIPDSTFGFLGDIKSLCDGPVATEVCEGTAEKFTAVLKGMAETYGAVSFGVAELCEKDYYSHKGRPIAQYGDEVEPAYKYGIVFAVEMDATLMNTAPYATESIATSKGYVDAAVIGMVLSYYIRSLGYEAHNNMDGNYLFPLPPVAEKAGLGEMGLNGLLVTPKYGPRVRLGMVSTNIPLVPHEKKPWGLRAFCHNCRRCESACVSQSIGNKKEGNEHGFYDSTCLGLWQRLGSDCGVCVIACPFAHNLPEDMIVDLKDKETRYALADYCRARFDRKKYDYNLPEWLEIAMKKDK